MSAGREKNTAPSQAVRIVVAHSLQQCRRPFLVALQQIAQLDVQFAFSNEVRDIEPEPGGPKLAIVDPSVAATTGRELGAIVRGLPMVAIDTKPTADTERLSRDAGVTSYFATPFETAAVVEAIRELLWPKGARPGRRFKRVQVCLHFNFSNEEILRAALSADVSEGGVFLVTDAPLPIGSPVHLAADVAGRSVIDATGVVVRVVASGAEGQGPMGMGIRFDEMRGNTREFIEALIGQSFELPVAEVAGDEVLALGDHREDLAATGVAAGGFVFAAAEPDSDAVLAIDSPLPETALGVPDGEGPFVTELVAWSNVIASIASGARSPEALATLDATLEHLPKQVKAALVAEAEDELVGITLRKTIAARLVVASRIAKLRRTRPYYSKVWDVLVTRAREDIDAVPEIVRTVRELLHDVSRGMRRWLEEELGALENALAALTEVHEARRVLVVPGFRRQLEALRERLDFRGGDPAAPSGADTSEQHPLPSDLEAWEVAAIMRSLSGVELDEILASLSVLRLFLIEAREDPGPEARRALKAMELAGLGLDFVHDACESVAVRDDLHRKRLQLVAVSVKLLEKSVGELERSHAGTRAVVDKAVRLLGRAEALRALLSQKVAGERAAAAVRSPKTRRQVRGKATSRLAGPDLLGRIKARPGRHLGYGALLIIVVPLAAYLFYHSMLAAPGDESTRKRVDVSAIAPVESSYMAKAHSGDVFLGVVTDEWSTLGEEERKQAVQRLLDAHGAGTIAELVLRNRAGEVVAHWNPRELRIMP